ncbi:iron ABC transporter permease [Campylobacter sp. MIT 21-1685]|nr:MULTISPECIES: iron ABC transporter permease [unclassified Campylobacter]MCX2683078.1 iron ABC transporter permease [Campylobacter sp. MIT 21-1684]MCX2751360.1 iron ABC transporter permease [Campylobacter sp. MIT 21-1682]MCX2807559.1 iron ABC transporter permease [Campylobacter sp. MIT 21-1685]
MTYSLKALKIVAVCIALFLCLPVLSIFGELLSVFFQNLWFENPSQLTSIKDNLHHFFTYLFIRFIKDTFLVVFGVLFCSLILGVSCAYLVAQFEFCGSRLLEKLLVLPLAIPAYILAFIYVGIMDYQSIFYEIFGFRVDFFNIYGAIFVLSISLFPYVYMFAKTAFKSEAVQLLEVAKTFGYSEFQIFFKVAIKSAKPAILSGLMLVFMETLSDYGASAYYGVDTFSAGIFKLWYDLGDPYSAAVLSGFLMVFVFIVMYIEYLYKVKQKYSFNQNLKVFIQKRTLSKVKSFFAFFYCFCIALLGFILPFLWLLYWGLQDAKIFESEFYSTLFKTLMLAAISAVIITIVAYFLSFVARISKHKFFSVVLLKTSSLGYAIPGAAIGVSVMIVFTLLGDMLDTALLGHSLLVLLFAYMIRFVATALYSLEGGYSKIHTQSDEVSLFIKPSFKTLFFSIHTPLLKHFLWLSFIIVFIDTIKELPLSRMLTPFGFETLGVKAFWYASDERIYDAALPSLCIVLLSLLAVVWIQSLSKEKEC